VVVDAPVDALENEVESVGADLENQVQPLQDDFVHQGEHADAQLGVVFEVLGHETECAVDEFDH